MNDQASEPQQVKPEKVKPEVLGGDPVEGDPAVQDSTGDNDPGSEKAAPVSEPAKVMRIGSMIRQLLAEVRTMDLDEKGRIRLREIYDTSIRELSGALSSELQAELRSLAMPFGEDDVPSDSELRIAQAQLVGWLEGLFHGIQATLFAQQVAAQNQLAQISQPQLLPPGGAPRRGAEPGEGGGVYL